MSQRLTRSKTSSANSSSVTSEEVQVAAPDSSTPTTSEEVQVATPGETAAVAESHSDSTPELSNDTLTTTTISSRESDSLSCFDLDPLQISASVPSGTEPTTVSAFVVRHPSASMQDGTHIVTVTTE